MSSTNFRKIDIDQYDEDVVQESELYLPDSRSPQEVTAISKEKAQQVRSLIGKGDGLNALKICVEQPPYGEGVEEAKVSISNEREDPW